MVSNGKMVYALTVRGDDPETPAKEGGIEGDSVSFRVGDRRAFPLVTWHSGLSERHNLSFSASPRAIYLPAVLKRR